MTTVKREFLQARRIVVKVGSSLVTHQGTSLNIDFLENLAGQLIALRAEARQVLLVSSGAIAAGMGRLGWTTRPTALHRLQAAAAIGQMALAMAYERCFSPAGCLTAQVLLTHEDLRDRARYLNARSTLHTLLALGVLPIINENDTVANEEIRFGDNDTLGALVANLMEADLLILLTDQQGLHEANPRDIPDAKLLYDVSAEDEMLEGIAGGRGSDIAKGGMLTKVRAARRAARSGAHTLIASGNEPQILLRLLKGENVGTFLKASLPPLAARKQWLADHLTLSGALILDQGAVKALGEGKSLLPVGVKKVEGDFQRGAPVACRNEGGREIARGLVNYSAAELRLIAGHASQDIPSLLEYTGEEEIIHRNNLVMQ